MKNKPRLVGLIAALSLSAVSAIANAAPIDITVFNRTSSSSDDVCLSAFSQRGCQETYSWTHNITDNGFNPATMTVLSSVLSVYLYDFDDDRFLEEFDIRYDAVPYGSDREIDGSASNPDRFNFVVTSSMLDGILNSTVRATSGDFKFDYARLVTTVDTRTSVPEPTTLALLGLGLAGLGFGRRKRNT